MRRRSSQRRVRRGPLFCVCGAAHAPYVPHYPQAFPKWSEVMDLWGKHMLNAVTSVAEMAALG